MFKPLKFVAALLAVLLTTNLGSAAESQASALLSTSGLELTNPFHVDLKVIPGINAKKNEIDGEDLRKRFVKRLTDAGFILGAQPSSGSLIVTLNTDGAGEFLALTVQFHRQITFSSNRKTYHAGADVWSENFNGKINQQLAVIPIVGEQLLDKFIEDHKRANPVSNLAGKVTASDPKYQFVVLNIGSDQGAEVKLEFAVKRAGKTIGAVKVVRVAKDHCVANPIEGTQTSDLLEGDTVVTR
jgi:hypothetical protein